MGVIVLDSASTWRYFTASRTRRHGPMEGGHCCIIILCFHSTENCAKSSERCLTFSSIDYFCQLLHNFCQGFA